MNRHCIYSCSSRGNTSTIKTSLLVERLGVGGGGSDVGIARSLVGAGLLLEGLGSSQVSVASSGVRSLVSGDGVDEGEGSEHCSELGKIPVLIEQQQLHLRPGSSLD